MATRRKANKAKSKADARKSAKKVVKPAPKRPVHTQLETVIINLLENAVKYSPPGTALHLRGEAIASPTTHCPLPTAYFSVCDEGPGLAPGDEERVTAQRRR